MTEKRESKGVKKTQLEMLKKELDSKTKQAEEYVSHLKRIQADFENFVKRTDKEKQQFVAQANQGLITALLTIMDEFEQALKSMQQHNVADHVYEGVEMIYKNLQTVLKSNGVTAIESMGKKADPYKHEVIVTEPKEDVEEDTILEEIQKGYQINDKVIRYAKVKVAKHGGN